MCLVAISSTRSADVPGARVLGAGLAKASPERMRPIFRPQERPQARTPA